MATHDGIQETAYDDFLTLFSHNSRRIFGYIMTLVVDVHDANDVYQETTLCLWKKYSEFTPGTSFFAWACEIARREVLKLRTDKTRRLHFSDELLNLLSANVLDRVIDLNHREQRLDECIKRLRPQEQELLERRYYLNQKPKDIACATSRSVFSVYRSLGRIHDLLFRCIERMSEERA